MNQRRDELRQELGRHNAEWDDERYRDREGQAGPIRLENTAGSHIRYGYGEGALGGFSYQRQYPNEGLASDYSVEGTHNFSREERRSISHRGKGPKGFRRSDERIKEIVSEVLADHHDIDASEIEVTVKDGEVTLTGSVTDRSTKRLAEDVIEHVSGVVDVHNLLRLNDARAH